MDAIKPIVVGYDSSPDAVRALSWAVELSRTNHQPLRVVVARGDLYVLSEWADEWTLGLAEEWADLARKQLSECGAEAEVAVVNGRAAEELVRESRAAGFVVVGSRGLGAVMGLLMGSVSQHVSRHAHCPVVVVRALADERSREVVVGVDGSTASLEALEMALDYSGMHMMDLSVIYAPERWKGYAEVRPALIAPELIAEFEAREGQVRRRIAEIAARHPGVAVRVHDVSGPPARELADASLHAALVVVGSRGRGAFAGMVLGSVSEDVLRHAHCPVAVIR